MATRFPERRFALSGSAKWSGTFSQVRAGRTFEPLPLVGCQHLLFHINPQISWQTLEFELNEIAFEYNNEIPG